MIHPAAARGFSQGAETYARGRPGFPPQIDDWLRTRLALDAGQRVLELGAGTGKFTPHLLKTGADVVALEPVAEMLAQLKLHAPQASPLLASAEEIPLSDESINAVVCAQSFHWFANPAALAEIRRVLHPGGRLGMIWNVRDVSVEWVARLTHIITPYEGDAPRYDRGEWRRLFPAPGLSPLEETRFRHGHTGPSRQVVLDRVASISFIAALEPVARNKVLDEVQRLIDSTPGLAGQNEVTFPYVTMAYHCRRDL